MARTAADVRRIHAQGRIASLIGVEGGGQIDGSLSVLRQYHALGAGYLTLTHSRTIDWADSATDNPKHDGLTPFGEAVVRELNRLGMLVDLSHVSEATMRDALRVTKAPVIFSHSSARAIDDHPRNVSDDVLKLVAANGGVVMVNYAPPYVSDAYRRWSADERAEKARLNAPPYRRALHRPAREGRRRAGRVAQGASRAARDAGARSPTISSTSPRSRASTMSASARTIDGVGEQPARGAGGRVAPIPRCSPS